MHALRPLALEALLGEVEFLNQANPELFIAGVVAEGDPRIEWVHSRAVHKALNEFGISGLRFIIEGILQNRVLDRELLV